MEKFAQAMAPTTYPLPPLRAPPKTNYQDRSKPASLNRDHLNQTHTRRMSNGPRGPTDDISEIDMNSDTRSLQHLRTNSMKKQNLMQSTHGSGYEGSHLGR